MIRLTPEQVLALQNEALHSFATRVVEELPGYRGPMTAGRSQKTLFRATTAAIDRAQTFEIETERALFLYVNIAMSLGAAFDSDPAVPWAHDILTDKAYIGGRERIDDLWNTYIDYCDAVMVAEGAEEVPLFPVEAYRAFADLPPPPADDGTLAPILADFRRIWPEKADLMSRDDLRIMVREMGARATDLGLTDTSAKWRFGRIGFLLGYAWDADPLHDWAWPILRDAGRGMKDAEVMNHIETGLHENVLKPALEWIDENDRDDLNPVDQRETA
ncbi:low molecular weight phosphatase family protein [Roseobacter weihaiensis]|uniref:hypothetical protein n=1 Tax=Roseobacter weihaiensis TaxID=2763262 RepID=UPI001D0BAC4D|nr:hypothetical protein [Roseobacter sp. H9]